MNEVEHFVNWTMPGCRVLLVDLPVSAGLAFWDEQDRPTIVVRKSLTGDVALFVAAHELAHLIRGHDPRRVSLEDVARGEVIREYLTEIGVEIPDPDPHVEDEADHLAALLFKRWKDFQEKQQ